VIRPVYLPLIFLLIGISSAGWLNGGPNYAEWRSYFSDPIFYSGGPYSKIDNSPYYPYFGEGFFRDPVQPIQLGSVVRQPSQDLSQPYRSKFRDVPFEDPYPLVFRKNWTQTMNYAKNSSSIQIYLNGNWTTMERWTGNFYFQDTN
jgi:hypothetical protein